MSCMLSVANKPFMLSVIMLNVVMLSDVALSKGLTLSLTSLTGFFGDR